MAAAIGLLRLKSDDVMTKDDNVGSFRHIFLFLSMLCQRIYWKIFGRGLFHANIQGFFIFFICYQVKNRTLILRIQLAYRK